MCLGNNWFSKKPDIFLRVGWTGLFLDSFEIFTSWPGYSLTESRVGPVFRGSGSSSSFAFCSLFSLWKDPMFFLNWPFMQKHLSGSSYHKHPSLIIFVSQHCIFTSRFLSAAYKVLLEITIQSSSRSNYVSLPSLSILVFSQHSFGV